MATGKTRRRPKASIRVRGFEDSDIDALAPIMQQASVIDGTLQIPHQSLSDVRRRWSSRLPGMYRLVAELDDKPVGLASVRKSQRPREAHIGSVAIAVSEHVRRRGVGGALVDALVELSEKWLGLLRLELDVWVDNEAAIQLYRSRGFKVEGVSRAQGLRDGKLVDALQMARLAEGLSFPRITAEDVAMRVPPLLTAGPDTTKN